MRRRVVACVPAAVCASLVCFASGCAADEAQTREAAFPGPVGYTAVGADSPGGSQSGAPRQPVPPAPQQASARNASPPGDATNGSAMPPAPASQQASEGNVRPPPPSQPPAGWSGNSGPPGPPPGWAAASSVGDTNPADAPIGPPSDGAVGGGPDEGAGYADTDPSALSDFRSTLDPYGSWVDDPTYGMVWTPSPTVVGQDFTPYESAGHWGYDDDYVWVSDYDWGWAPFHYGRWVYAGSMGWEWIPGRTYAGAWVAWRYGVGDWGYVGWAPLGPTWGWRGGAAVGLGFVPSAPYSFVGGRDLFAPSLAGRFVTGPQVGVVASHTQPYVPASPRGGTPTGMRFAVGGPPLSALHISPSAVAHVSAASNRGLAQARAFSRPSTAVALGARGPQLAAARAAVSFRSTRLSGNVAGSTTPMYATRVPAYAPDASHFGGRLGAGFVGSPASAPPPRAYSGGPASSSYAGQRETPGAYGGRGSPSIPGSAYRSYSAPSGVSNSATRGAPAPAPSGGAGFHTGSGPSSGGGRSGGRR